MDKTKRWSCSSPFNLVKADFSKLEKLFETHQKINPSILMDKTAGFGIKLTIEDLRRTAEVKKEGFGLKSYLLELNQKLSKCYQGSLGINRSLTPYLNVKDKDILHVFEKNIMVEKFSKNISSIRSFKPNQTPLRKAIEDHIRKMEQTKETPND